MARFRLHPAQLALALTIVATAVLPLSACGAASQSGGQTSTPFQRGDVGCPADLLCPVGAS
jgi:hypothetical protein